jgi:hypothetical protein
MSNYPFVKIPHLTGKNAMNRVCGTQRSVA